MSSGLWKKLHTGMVLTLAATLCLMLTLPGCGKKEPGVDELWQKSKEAEEKITSLHMEIAIFYQNTKYGGGQIQTTSINISGDNIHLQSSVFGQSFSEVIVTGGKQYGRFMGEEKWAEQPVSITQQAAVQQIEGFSNLPNIASSKENKGIEKVGGKDAYHLVFVLTPEEVRELFKNVPVSQLSDNSGGTVDVWVDKESNYRIRYEALVKNVLITEQVGRGDVQIIAAISNINEPIKINPPV